MDDSLLAVALATDSSAEPRFASLGMGAKGRILVVNEALRQFAQGQTLAEVVLEPIRQDLSHV
jgi:hypothetical protein